MIAALRELRELRVDGTLTEEEFVAAKSHLLDASQGASTHRSTRSSSVTEPSGSVSDSLVSASFAPAESAPRVSATAADYVLGLIFAGATASRETARSHILRFPGDSASDAEFVATRRQLDRITVRAIGHDCPLRECMRLMAEAASVAARPTPSRATHNTRGIAPMQLMAAVRHTCIDELGLADIPRGVRLATPPTPLSSAQLYDGVGRYFEELNMLVHNEPSIDRATSRALACAALASATVSVAGAVYTQRVVAALAEFTRLSRGGQDKSSAAVYRLASVLCGAAPALSSGARGATPGQADILGAERSLDTWSAWNVLRAQLDSSGMLRQNGFLRALARLECDEMAVYIDDLCRLVGVDPEAYRAVPSGAPATHITKYSGAEYGAAIAALARLFHASKAQLFSIWEWTFFARPGRSNGPAGGVRSGPSARGPPLPPIVEHDFFAQLVLVSEQLYLLQRTWDAKSAVLNAEASRLRTQLLSDSKMESLCRSLCDSIDPGGVNFECIDIALGATYRPSSAGLHAPIPPALVLDGIMKLLDYLGVSPALIGRPIDDASRYADEPEESIDELKPCVYWLGRDIDELVTSTVTVKTMYDILSDTLASVEQALNLPFYGEA